MPQDSDKRHTEEPSAPSTACDDAVRPDGHGMLVVLDAEWMAQRDTLQLVPKLPFRLSCSFSLSLLFISSAIFAVFSVSSWVSSSSSSSSPICVFSPHPFRCGTRSHVGSSPNDNMMCFAPFKLVCAKHEVTSVMEVVSFSRSLRQIVDQTFWQRGFDRWL